MADNESKGNKNPIPSYDEDRSLFANANKSYVEAKEKLAKIFKGKTSHEESHKRLPPGQYLTENFPILDLGIRPDFNPTTWELKVGGEVDNPVSLNYQQLLKLPKTYMTADFHCVTRWSKYDVKWAGVRFKDLALIAKPKPTAATVVAWGAEGYTTNVPLNEMLLDNVLIAYELEGKPLSKEHGAPARIVNPNLYGWKGAKFLKRLEFLDHDAPGFWETRGYNNHGDFHKEERYSD